MYSQHPEIAARWDKEGKNKVEPSKKSSIKYSKSNPKAPAAVKNQTAAKKAAFQKRGKK